VYTSVYTGLSSVPGRIKQVVCRLSAGNNNKRMPRFKTEYFSGRPC
jgi:hypothetical protein